MSNLAKDYELPLHMASHANAMAQHLQLGILNSKDARLAWKAEVEGLIALLD